MLMDLFYKTLPLSFASGSPVPLKRRRVHFHAFMIDVHKRIHAMKVELNRRGGGDPIAPVGRELAREANVLCFDEFQVRVFTLFISELTF
jgi:peroxisome-assembly ATPase